MTGANVPALIGQLRTCGMTDGDVDRVFATFNVAAPAFARARKSDEPPE
jgi:hypothetical protein